MFKNLKLSTRLTIASWLIGLLPLAIGGILTYLVATSALNQAAFDGLTTALVNKQAALEVFIQGREASTKILADTLSLLPAAPPESYLQRFAARRGFADIFLIDRAGQVTEAIHNQSLRGAELAAAAYANTGLGRLFRKIRDGGEGVFIDFTLFAIGNQGSDNAPAALMGEPFSRADGTGGIVAVLLAPNSIEALMTHREGLGSSGEAYLVGPDKRMRSDAGLSGGQRTVAASLAGTVERNGVDTEPVREALAGRSGTILTEDYRGVEVLSAFAPLEVAPGLNWALIVEKDRDEAFAPILELQLYYLGIGLLALIAIAVAARLTARTITRPMGQVLNITDEIAQGDLNRHLTAGSRDEVGQLMAAVGRMADRLRQVVTEVRAATEQVSTAAAEIAKGNLDLSQRTEEQASSLEETASSMEELTGTVRQNADNAERANHLARAAKDRAHQGQQLTEQAVLAMDQINAGSRQIADIIGVIDSIAFQTNILALNAAVEAARAGEHGRGFAVVSGEVRQLAQRSADAAKEIKTLITTSVGRIEEGSRLVREAGAAMQAILAAVQEVSDMVAEISAASREQAIGIEQVNKAVVQMDEVTQQNAALVEEVTAAAAALDSQARELKHTIDFFRLEETAPTDALPSPQAAATPVFALNHGAGGGHHGRPTPRRDPGQRSAPRDKARPGRVFDHRDDDWTEF